jgi:hypothetical protein
MWCLPHDVPTDWYEIDDQTGPRCKKKINEGKTIHSEFDASQEAAGKTGRESEREREGGREGERERQRKIEGEKERASV